MVDRDTFRPAIPAGTLYSRQGNAADLAFFLMASLWPNLPRRVSRPVNNGSRHSSSIGNAKLSLDGKSWRGPSYLRSRRVKATGKGQ